MNRANTTIGPIAISIAVLTVGCADPCFDDGLDQGGCPSDETESETETSNSNSNSNSDTRDTDSSSNSNSNSNSNTESQGTMTATDPDSASGGMFECPELMEVLLPKVPTFQVVIDASGSMDEDFGGETRWEAIRSTLVGGQNGVVTRLQSNIRFGVSIYNNPAQSDVCPSVEELSPQLDAADEIVTALDASAPAGDTPTGEALRAATSTLQDDTWDGEKFLLLATDGEPDTCEVRNPETDEEIAMARAEAVAAVEEAFGAGIKTFVVSVGAEIGEEHLQDLADAGQGGTDQQFYLALDGDSLVEAFNDVISGLRTCELELPSPLMPDLAPSCSLTINETAFPLDGADGWRLIDATTIELQGGACSAIQEGLVSIEMECTCTVGAGA